MKVEDKRASLNKWKRIEGLFKKIGTESHIACIFLAKSKPKSKSYFRNHGVFRRRKILMLLLYVVLVRIEHVGELPI